MRYAWPRPRRKAAQCNPGSIVDSSLQIVRPTMRGETFCEMCSSLNNVSNMKGLKLQFSGPEKSITAVGQNFVNLLHHSQQGPILISSFDRVWQLAGAADEENG